MKEKIKPNQSLVADEGYRGEHECVAIRNEFYTKDVKNFKDRAKARQETVNMRLKSFAILNQAFRTTGKPRLERHKAAFEVCITIVQYELDNSSSLFIVYFFSN